MPVGDKENKMTLILEPRQIKIKIPMVPNYVFSTNNHQFNVGELDDKMLKSLGKQWTNNLIKNAHRWRKMK